MGFSRLEYKWNKGMSPTLSFCRIPGVGGMKESVWQKMQVSNL